MAPSGAPDTGPEQPPLLPPRHQDCGPDRHIPHCPTELSRLLDDARTEREALRREQIYAVRLAEAAEARIGAALAAYGNGLGRAAMYRALTGDTP